jgi:hypothetical protein
MTENHTSDGNIACTVFQSGPETTRSRTLNSMYISYPVRQNLTSLCTYFEQARFLPIRPALKVYKRYLMQPDNVPVGILAFILDASQRSLPEIGLHD